MESKIERDLTKSIENDLNIFFNINNQSLNNMDICFKINDEKKIKDNLKLRPISG